MARLLVLRERRREVVAVQPGARVDVLQPHARARLQRRALRALLALRNT